MGEYSPKISEVERNRENLLMPLREGEQFGFSRLTYSLDSLMPYLKPLQLPFSYVSNAISIDGDYYDLDVSVSGRDSNIKIIDPSGRKYHINRSQEDNIIAAVWHGDFNLLSKSFSEHWGVSVADEFKGKGVADLCYALKLAVDEQLPHEYVNAGDYVFLQFYLKKGYIPESLIFGDGREDILSESDSIELIRRVRESRSKKMQISMAPFAFRLTLDPVRAQEFYEKIRI